MNSKRNLIKLGAIGTVAASVVLLIAWAIGAPTSPLFALLQSLATGVLVASGAAWLQPASPVSALEAPSDGSNEESMTQPDFDPLTNTLNQRGIAAKLLELMALGDRYGNRLAIAVAGIDHLNDVNAHYSREVGDRVLSAIAQALTDTVRMPDRLGRWGDDQFLIVLPETDLQGARKIAERFREQVSNVDIEANRRTKIRLTVSIGVTAFRRGDDLQGLVSRAIRAMEAAKHQGRNRVLTDLAA